MKLFYDLLHTAGVDRGSEGDSQEYKGDYEGDGPFPEHGECHGVPWIAWDELDIVRVLSRP